MNFPVIEMFASIQGEGEYTGYPSFFVRVSGCNLRCCFKGSICDTPYSSYEPEKTKYKSIKDVVNDFRNMEAKYPKINHLVITGGEPLLYKEGLCEFLKEVYRDDMFVTIETNGTLEPIPANNPDFMIDMYSISPKLSTSVGNGNGKLSDIQMNLHNKTRINIPNLYKYVLDSIDYQFKFVYSGEECINEIEDLYKQLEKYGEENFNNQESDYKHDWFLSYHPNYHTKLMPEGVTNEQLQKSRNECVEKCMEKGWEYTDRMHIVIWGDKRGV